MSVSAAYIFGFPDDNLETMQKTLDFAYELQAEQANFHSMMAYPDTPLYKEALKNGWEVPTEWKQYSQYSYECLPVRTKYLTSKEVLKFRDDAFHYYHSRPEYLELIRKKFGEETVHEIQSINSIKLRRKLYEA